VIRFRSYRHYREGQTHALQAGERALPANLAPLVKKLEAAAGKR